MSWHDVAVDPVVIAPESVIGAVPGARKGLAPKIRALRERYPEMSQSAIARRVGCRPSNVTGVLKTYLNGIPEADLEQFRVCKTEVLEAIQHRTLSSITPAHLAKASALQLVTAAAILEDKIRLRQGQPTSIHANLLVDLAEVLRQRDGE